MVPSLGLKRAPLLSKPFQAFDAIKDRGDFIFFFQSFNDLVVRLRRVPVQNVPFYIVDFNDFFSFKVPRHICDRRVQIYGNDSDGNVREMSSFISFCFSKRLHELSHEPF